MSDEIKENILSPSQWLRILFMALFGLICWVLGLVITALVLGQALFSIITGKDNSHLRHAGDVLTQYFNQILRFLTYSSEDKPFPFAPLPEAGDTNEYDDDYEDEDEIITVVDVESEEDTDEVVEDEISEEDVVFNNGQASDHDISSSECEFEIDIKPSESDEPIQENEPEIEYFSPTQETIAEDEVPNKDEPEDDVFADISFNNPVVIDDDDDDDKKSETP